jgi:chemotaxis protein MotB
MLATRLLSGCVVLTLLAVLPGCLVPQSQLSAIEGKNKALTDRNRALEARIENLDVHARNTEDLLIRTEEDLAMLEERSGLDGKQLANYRYERDKIHEQFRGLFDGSGVTPEVRGQLAEISKRYPHLNFDPVTGAGKLDTDILFDQGEDALKPGAEGVLGELVRVLQSPEGRDLRVVVVGHTDDKLIAKKPAREKYSDNFRLSTSRAHTVADRLRELGLAHERMIVIGAGPHQPIAPNTSEENRRKNRRVELFVTAPEVPVIGWTETVPSLY